MFSWDRGGQVFRKRCCGCGERLVSDFSKVLFFRHFPYLLFYVRLSETCVLHPLLPSCNDCIAEYVRKYQFGLLLAIWQKQWIKTMNRKGLPERTCLMWWCFAIMSHFFIFCVFEREIEAHLGLMWVFKMLCPFCPFESRLPPLQYLHHPGRVDVSTRSPAGHCFT